MMTPAQHYAEAARLATSSQRVIERATTNTVKEVLEVATVHAHLAQVHATLALAGSTFLAQREGMYPTAANELADVLTGTPSTLSPDRQRLEAARQALIETGYFTPEQVGDDIAPRITELLGAQGIVARAWTGMQS
jgi:hypothetical protein